MDEFFGYVLILIMFIIPLVMWLYGIFILFMNKDNSNGKFDWGWTGRHNPKNWVGTCIITNFIVGWMSIFSIIVLIPRSESTFQNVCEFSILLVFSISNLLSYTGIKSLFKRINKDFVFNEEESNTDNYSIPIKPKRKRKKVKEQISDIKNTKE